MSSSLAELIHQAQDGFAVNLLYELSLRNATHQSVVVSPISVAMALSMVLLGAEDKTAHEMDQLLANNANFIGNAVERAQEMKICPLATKLWPKNREQRINGFVANVTHEKIQELVEPDMFDAFSSRLVLVNAVYFKGLWANPFNPKHTVRRSFHVDEGHQKELEMMVQTGEFEYNETEQSQVLVLPYSGNDIKLYVLLPKDRFGLAQALANFSASQTLLGGERMHKREVKVVLPKFKLESTHDLKTPLANMGMPSAFSDNAQFGLISNEDRMKIDFVVQEAMIEINEEGTEAAAGSAVGNVVPVSAPRPPVEFVADHPFAFFLVASNGPLKNDVLFAGVFYG